VLWQSDVEYVIITIIPLFHTIKNHQESSKIDRTKIMSNLQLRHGLFFVCLTIAHQSSFGGFLDGLIKPLLRNQDKRIIFAAQQNMSPELQACKNFDDLEALLRKEEKQCLDDIKESFNVPDQAWNKCLAEIQEQLQYCREVYFKSTYPNVNHDFSKADPKFYQYVRHVLTTQYGINPGSLHIVYDQNYHDKHQKAEAHTRSPEFQQITSVPKGFEVRTLAQMSFLPRNCPKASSEDYREFVPYHEGVHLFEGHELQERLVHKTLMSSSKHYREVSSHVSLKKWHKMQEKIADISPLIKFKNPEHVKILYNICMHSCKCKIDNGQNITWNESPVDATHPDWCAEILPWILKMQELKHLKTRTTTPNH
jgi:hypothetical protein